MKHSVKMMGVGLFAASLFALAACSGNVRETPNESSDNTTNSNSATNNSSTTNNSSATGDISASYVNTKYASGETDSRLGQTAWKMANCHDPKLFQDDDGTYYVYATDASCGNIGKVGVHVRYSTDLINWTGSATSALAGNWDEDFLAWEGFKASSSETVQNNSSYTAATWAPTVIKQNGLYYMYHGVNADVAYGDGTKTAWASSIVLAIASSAKGPFYPASTLSAYTGSDTDMLAIKAKLESLGVSYSQNFLVRYSALANKTRAENSSLDGTEIDNPDYADSNNSRFGCIDPEFVYDVATGELKSYTLGDNTCYAMIYGSWLYGISLIYVDAISLKPVANEAFSYTDDNSYTVSVALGQALDMSLDQANKLAYPSNSSAYHLIGTRIAGGYGAGYEGAQLFYNSNTGWYYLITSCGGLDYEYRCTLGRSEDIAGPYYDAGGKNMVLTSTASDENYSANYHAVGSKIIGSYALDDEYSFRCQGGLSIYRSSDGKILFANHTRTNFQMGYYFYLQIHQMFFTDDGWPVLNQNEYYNDYAGYTSDGTEGLSALTVDDVAGDYNTILTVRGTDSAAVSTLGIYGASSVTTLANVCDAVPTASKTMTLYADGSIGGTDYNYGGTWALADDGYSITLDLEDGDGNALGTFKGYALHAVDWAQKGGASATRRTITFTSICADSTAAEAGEFFWGNRSGDATGSSGQTTTYADRYAAATLQATYTLTIADSAKDDLGWYLYPQYGTWTYVVDDGSGETEAQSVSGADAWWAGQSGHTTESYALSDGGSVTFYASTTASNGTLVIEGLSASAGYADIDPHTTADGWGDAVAAWGTSDSRTALGYEAQSLKIEISRSGTTQIVKIYKK